MDSKYAQKKPEKGMLGVYHSKNYCKWCNTECSNKGSDLILWDCANAS